MSSLDRLAQSLSNALRARKLRLVTAESCTGGGIAEAVTRIPGSSDVFERGFVTYSNTSKLELLDVKPMTLKKYGAVSEPVVREMAMGALKNSRGEAAIAISGIAGPDGGSAEKPVGTICFAWAVKHGALVSRTTHFPGDRKAVRERATAAALAGMLDVLLPVTIRLPGNGDDVCSVHRSAFPTGSEARLVNELRAQGKSVVSLVAECGSRIVGHILFSPVTIDERPVNGVGLAPIAVLPEMQNRGIGSTLVRAGLEACRRAGVGFVVVLGEPGFYERFGFERANARGLRNEYGADAEFMVFELASNSLPADGGLVKYAPEFGKLVFDRG